MALIEFVNNFEDQSTDRGYQFKFLCDKCGGGWVSEFETSAAGIGGSILRAAGGLFGGILGHVAGNEEELRRLAQGKGHDEALQRAVALGKQRFKKCTRCGHWVCPETCWNAERGLCEDCAPDLAEEASAAQAQAARDQLVQKAAAVDQTEGLDVGQKVRLRCPKCNAATKGGKFCPECGAPLSSKRACKGCGADMDTAAKFCPECGDKQA